LTNFASRVLCYRYRLRQVAGLVGVKAPGGGQVIGQELERHDTYQGIEDFLDLGNLNPLIKGLFLMLGNTDDISPTCPGPGSIGQGLRKV